MPSERLIMTGKARVASFCVLTALVSGGLGTLEGLLLGWFGVLAAIAGGIVIGHFSFRYAMDRWGGWKWVSRG